MILAQCVLPVGFMVPASQEGTNPEHVELAGTCFAVRRDSYYATANHILSNYIGKLCILAPQILNLDDYQDQSVKQSACWFAKIVEQDPIRDIAIIKADINYINLPCPTIEGLDGLRVGDPLAAIGYPHATDARRVLTLQKTTLGAKILVDYHGIKTKNSIINIQTSARPIGLSNYFIEICWYSNLSSRCWDAARGLYPKKYANIDYAWNGFKGIKSNYALCFFGIY